MIRFIFFLFFVFCFAFVAAQSLKGKSVILYTKNGKGYVHDNIPSATKCFDSLSHALGFKLFKSPDATIFTEEQLKKTDLIIFASTNNDVFDTDAQRLSFRHYFEAGGRVLAIHSAIGTERNWTWFKQMLGGTFSDKGNMQNMSKSIQILSEKCKTGDQYACSQINSISK